MIGLLCVHYYVIQKQKFHVPDLYEGSKKSIYWYWNGINWRTAVAWLLSVVPNMPGFIYGTNNRLWAPVGAQRIYDLSFLVGFLLSSIISIALYRLFPYHYHFEGSATPEPDTGTLDGVEVVEDFRQKSASLVKQEERF